MCLFISSIQYQLPVKWHKSSFTSWWGVKLFFFSLSLSLRHLLSVPVGVFWVSLYRLVSSDASLFLLWASLSLSVQAFVFLSLWTSLEQSRQQCHVSFKETAALTVFSSFVVFIFRGSESMNAVRRSARTKTTWMQSPVSPPTTVWIINILLQETPAWILRQLIKWHRLQNTWRSTSSKISIKDLI